MNRIEKLKMNSSVSLLSRVVMIVSGLILPRLILSNFGAETHGLVNSINQFLGVITFLDLGVGSVVKSALYRPLAKKDSNQISRVIIAARSYFQKIAYILIVYVLGLILFYPYLIDSSYSYLATAFLILALSISQFGQYYFGIVNELLLSANQQAYVQLSSEIIVVILNLIISVILIQLGGSIQIVKLGSGLIYLIRPIYLSYYVNKNFDINYDIELKEDPLPQRWNGMGQHIAYSIQNNTDVVILTIFSTLEAVSIYAVYSMFTTAIKTLILSLTTGIQSFFGDLYASKEINLLNIYFDRIEWIIHTAVIFLYGMTAVLINSFVMLYTIDVEDISYEAPLFSILLVLASIVNSLRIPYHSMILSSGHFRQTQMSSFIEAGLNIIISVILVKRFGLIGITFGTLVAVTYRTLYLVAYLSRNILNRPISKFFKQIFVNVLSMTLILFTGHCIKNIFIIVTFIDWIKFSFILAILSSVILLVINLFFFKNVIFSIFKKKY